MPGASTLEGFLIFRILERIKTMTKRTFVDVKTALAEKYERLARLTSSVPRKASYSNLALRYRRQAAQAARDGHK